MTKNPILNALCAIAYIAGLVSLVFYGQMIINVPFGDAPTVLIPIAFLSVFVFSAALMGYLFLYQPLLLILAGEKKQGTDLFLKTVAAFGVSAFVLVVAGLLVTSIV